MSGVLPWHIAPQRCAGGGQLIPDPVVAAAVVPGPVAGPVTPDPVTEGLPFVVLVAPWPAVLVLPELVTPEAPPWPPAPPGESMVLPVAQAPRAPRASANVASEPVHETAPATSFTACLPRTTIFAEPASEGNLVAIKLA